MDKEGPVPRLSILIPCLGGAAEFDGTLVSVLSHRPADCEVLVVHREAYGDPYGLRGEVDFVQMADASLVEMVNVGLERASGEVVHVIGCGLEVAEGWCAAALAHFEDAEVAAVSPAIIAADGTTLVCGGIRYGLGGARREVSDQRLLSPGTGRLRASVLGPSLVAAFYRRDVLAALEGLDERVGDQLADVDAALAIKALGRLHVCEPNSRLIQSAKPHNISSNGFADGRASERLFWKYAASHGIGLSILPHLVTIAAAWGNPVRGAAAFAGRLAAALEVGTAARHEERLAHAQERLTELAALRAAKRSSGKRALRKVAAEQIGQRKAA
jgi:hypothetical protein